MHVNLRNSTTRSQWTTVRKANQVVHEGLINALARSDRFGISDLGSPRFGDKNRILSHIEIRIYCSFFPFRTRTAFKASDL